MSFLEKNLAALRRIDPETAKWIAESPALDWAEPVRQADGSLNLALTLDGNKELYYNREDPLGTARREVDEEAATPEKLTAILGLGLGYSLMAVLGAARPGHQILVVERHGFFVRMCLTEFDLARELAGGTVLIAGPGEAELINIIAQIDLNRLNPDNASIVEKYTDARPKDYLPLYAKFTAEVASRQVGVNTLLKGGPEIIRSVMENLPVFLRRRGILELRGINRGYPAIVVATGPSLSKNIHLLREARGKALILAVGQALRPLLGYGIRPDAILFVDYLERSFDHLEGLCAQEDIPLIALNGVCPKLLRSWQGPIFLSGNQRVGHNNFLENLSLEKGHLPQAGSVSHMAYEAAVMLGSDPVVFVGLDLAPGDKFTHFDQADKRHLIESAENGVFKSKIDDKRASNQDGFQEQLTSMTVGYYGQPIMTYGALSAQRHELEKFIGNHQTRVINSTEGGAHINGTERLPLKAVLDRYCTRPRPSSLTGFNGLADNAVEATRRAVESLNRELGFLSEIKRSSAEAVRVGEKMRRIVKKGPPKPNQIKRLNGMKDRFEVAAKRADENLHAVHSANLMMQRLILKSKLVKPPQYLILERMSYNHTMLRLSKQAAASVEDLHHRTVDRLDRLARLTERVTANDRDWGAWLELGRSHWEIGEFRAAADCLARAAAEAPDEVQPLVELGRLSLARERWSELEEVIERLRRIEDGQARAAGLALERDEFLDGLLKTAEDDFEAGNFVRPLVDAERYLRARPDDSRAMAVRARALAMRADRIAEAEAEYEQSLEKYYEGEYQRLLTKSRKAGGQAKDFNQAIRLLEKAMAIFPSRIEARWGLATSLHLVGRSRESVNIFRELIAEHPDNYQLVYELGMVQVQLGHATEGLSLLWQAIEADPKLAPTLAQMGDLYRRLGEPGEALRCYDRLLQLDGPPVETWTRRGDCLMELGNPADADTAYRRALDFNPGFEPALAGLKRLGSRPNQVSA